MTLDASYVRSSGWLLLVVATSNHNGMPPVCARAIHQRLHFCDYCERFCMLLHRTRALRRQAPGVPFWQAASIVAMVPLAAPNTAQQSRRSPTCRIYSRADADRATQQLHSIISELRADPALAPLLEDSKVAQAIREVAADPVNMQKHCNNPKVGCCDDWIVLCLPRKSDTTLACSDVCVQFNHAGSSASASNAQLLICATCR